VIDRSTSASLEKIASRERDTMHAYEPGFVPESSDVARPSRPVPVADALSVAAPQGAYFLGVDANGKIAFSRDGAFAIAGGELRAPGGRPVLGFALGDRRSLAPLRIDPYDSALGRVSDARVDADGTFGYTRTSIDPRSAGRRSERIIVGRVAIARFPAGTQPVRVDSVHVTAPAGVGAQIGVPADGSFAALAPHSRDLGSVDLVASLERMKEAYDSFEAQRAAHHARGEVEKTTMDLVK
jgi:flagellar basal body rod protein FlgG